ncbi:acetyltransferase (GNAT) family protein [Kushneria sinocarnis]|uniref:Acetyltransferase (GNAT) family protein n=1 Tax=Kushneria sinocarnis TaxID=595502 RepID=A0A420WU71_9GAMM|nr:GNAT family N-acetyltransferase [Kushneria sinocarnis]RKQ96993.1 acetyltransferase (GNAT) family protein [Kushneria sinocarnis]
MPTSNHQLSDHFPGFENIEAWAIGWSRTRETLPPTRHDGYLHIRVGALRQQARYIMTTPDPVRVRALIARIHEPHVYIKLFAPAAVVTPLLPEPWQLDPPVQLMTTALSPTAEAPARPSGYRATVTSHEHFTAIEIETRHGELAASGRLALARDYAIFDQIETHRAHQRRGLGRHVMQVLGNIACDHGAHRALLGASEEGQALYRHLGWENLAPISSIARKVAG